MVYLLNQFWNSPVLCSHNLKFKLRITRGKATASGWLLKLLQASLVVSSHFLPSSGSSSDEELGRKIWTSVIPEEGRQGEGRGFNGVKFIPCFWDSELPLSDIQHPVAWLSKQNSREKLAHHLPWSAPQIPLLGENSRKGKEEGRSSH